MKKTKFFILIPVYNVEKYLEDCLNSILLQDYSEYEIVLVDDGSKDSSGKICDRYAIENEHIHVVHKNNEGQISARLAAIDFVYKNTEYDDTYCLFVDSDDELKEGTLKVINQKIVSHSCDMLIFGYEKFDQNGIFYTTLEEKTNEMLIEDMGELFRKAVIEHTYNSLCRKAVKTEMLFFEINECFKSIQMGEDLLQSIGLYKQNPRTLIIPDILYRYRVNSESITQTFKLKRFTDELLSRYYTVKFIEELNVWNKNDFEKYFNKSIFVVQWDVIHIIKESPSKSDALYNLKQIYEHPFVQEYCLNRISNQSSIWLREFSKGHFRRLLILHKISLIKSLVKEKKKVVRE